MVQTFDLLLTMVKGNEMDMKMQVCGYYVNHVLT